MRSNTTNTSISMSEAVVSAAPAAPATVAVKGMKKNGMLHQVCLGITKD
mgnify:CR=1 FL=1